MYNVRINVTPELKTDIMSVGASGFSDSSFTVLYIPTVAMAYLWSSPNIQIWEIPILTFGVDLSLDLLAIFTFICLLGSIQHHAITKAIFGPSGPTHNPKKTSTALKSVLRIVIQANQESSTVARDGRSQIRYALDEFESKNLFKMFTFSPLMFLQIARYGLLAAYFYLVLLIEVVNFIGIILFLSLITLEIRGGVTRYIPNPHNVQPENLEPEFERDEDPKPEYGS